MRQAVMREMRNRVRIVIALGASLLALESLEAGLELMATLPWKP